MRAYYFTKAEYAIDAVKKQRYKLSTYDNLNDPFELFSTVHADPYLRDIFRQFKKMMSEEEAILCCSKGWRSTLMWSHYADKHRGAVLELEVPDKRAATIRYQRKRLPIDRADMEACLRGENRRDIVDELTLIKSAEWSYEKEIRLSYPLKRLPPPVDGRYFMPFREEDVALVGFIIGPLCRLSLEDIRDALPPGRSLEVTKARIAFNEYKIVADQRCEGVLVSK